MPIRFMPEGVIECDTPAEAAELRELLGAHKSAGFSTGEIGDSQRGTSAVKDGLLGTVAASANGFLMNLNPNGKKVVIALARAYPEPLKTDDLAEQAKMDATVLGPVFKHIYRAGAKAGFEPEAVLVRARHPGDPPNKYRYQLSQRVADAARLRWKAEMK
jgi:hypothetical protein